MSPKPAKNVAAPEKAPSQEDELRGAWDLFHDHEGHVLAKDIGTILRLLGYFPSEAQVAALLQRIVPVIAGKASELTKGQRANLQRPIDFASFSRAVEESPDLLEISTANVNERQMQSAFSVFDKDKNGYISRDELRQALTGHGEKLSEREINQLFTIVDANKDGRIQFSEFIVLSMMSEFSIGQR